MELVVDRKWKKETYTIGNLYVDGKKFCNTLEDKDRGLKSTSPLSLIKKVKVKAETAIPTGTYEVAMNIISPKYSLKPWYVTNCHGARMPRIQNIPGYSGVLVHPGNSNRDTEGCLLVGKNNVVGMVTDSKATFLKLYNQMYAAYKKGEKIIITFK